MSGRRIASISEEHVESVDPEDGAALWRSPLPGEAGNRDAWIMCADPLVVASTGHGRRGERRISVFDDSGNVTASLSLPPAYRNVALPAAVVNGVLVTGLVHPDASSDEHARIGGFDLSTGKLRWERRPGGISVQSLLPHRGLLLVLHSFGSKITALDARDGRVVARRRLRGYGGSALLRVAGARFAVIGRSGGRSPCGSSTGAEIGPAHQGSAFRLSAPDRSDLRAGQAQGPRWIRELYHSTLVKPSACTGRRMTRTRAWKQ